jgi:GNAT superfamily N-acetyltransferase
MPDTPSVNADLVGTGDLTAVAAMMVAAFSDLVERRFRQTDRATAFYEDLYAMVLATNGPTFLAHRINGELAGFASVTWPSRPIAAALWQAGRWRRLIQRGLSGAYGFHPRFLVDTLRELLLPRRPVPDRTLRPCLYAIVVRPDFRGRGVGRTLLRRAKEAAGRSGMWLLVSEKSEGVVRLYEAEGFRTVRRHGGDLAMVWEGSEP